ncbi:MAG: hypothetical protein KDH96_04025 [Candidatus Riesia sp.]|nr:hypothetical protein [Candidatus Riesia sp.]
MRLGDSIWWQSRSIFWTPKGEGAAEALEEHSIKFKTDSQGRPYDVYLPRVGLSYTDKDRENGWYSSI